MKVVVLGARGFIGSHLCKRLEKDGHTVAPIGRMMRDGDRQIAANGCDAVINCAGQLTQLNRMVYDNIDLVSEWLCYCHNESIPRFIQIGSSSETGPVEGPRIESMPCAPSNLYEATKLAATHLCLGYAKEYGMDVAVARPFTIYGPGDTPRKMLPALWRAWTEEKEFTCYPGGHDWTHIDDFVEGIVKMLIAPGTSIRGQIFNLGTGINTWNERIVELFNKHVSGGGVKVRYSPTKYHAYDVMDWRADTTKTREELGWQSTISIEDGIFRFVADEWFKNEATPAL